MIYRLHLKNEEGISTLKRAWQKYPGLKRIMTKKKILAYDRGEYDDLDNLPPQRRVSINCYRSVQSIIERCNWSWIDADYHHEEEWAKLRVRQYEAELISRYKAGLL